MVSFQLFFRDFGYKMIRLKYFIMIVFGLILEILTLTLYLLKLQNVVQFELFSLSILYGAISSIIVVLAVGILVLMKADKKRDADKIKNFQEFEKKYNELTAKHLNDINVLVRSFENEKTDLDRKLGYAEELEEKYSAYLKELSDCDVASFLKFAHEHESEHLEKEIEFYKGFTSLANLDDLKNISSDSEECHNDFLKEMHRIEKSLRLII